MFVVFSTIALVKTDGSNEAGGKNVLIDQLNKSIVMHIFVFSYFRVSVIDI